MKYMEWVQGNFYTVEIKSNVLYDIIESSENSDEYWPFGTTNDGKVGFYWFTRADAYLGGEEKSIQFRTVSPANGIGNYLVQLINTYKTVGLKDYYEWREAVRFFDNDQGICFADRDSLLDEWASPDEMNHVLQMLNENLDAINASAEEYTVIELFVDGERCGASDAHWYLSKGGVEYEGRLSEEKINEITDTAFFVDDLLNDDDSPLDVLFETINEEYEELAERRI